MFAVLAIAIAMALFMTIFAGLAALLPRLENLFVRSLDRAKAPRTARTPGTASHHVEVASGIVA